MLHELNNYMTHNNQTLKIINKINKRYGKHEESSGLSPSPKDWLEVFTAHLINSRVRAIWIGGRTGVFIPGGRHCYREGSLLGSR